MPMEFWGVEVKPGQPLKVTRDADKYIHISQASLGEIKDDKAAKNVVLRLRVDQGIFIIGSLSAGERPQISTDLILDRPFELSHDLKSGSVYFLGYSNVLLEDESESEDFDSEEDLPITAPANETPELKADDSKQEKKTELKVDDSKQEKITAAPQQVSKKHAPKTPSEPAKEEPASEEDDDSDDDVENDDGDSEDSDDIMEGDNSSDDQEEVSDDDDEDDESDEEPEEKPKEKSKKRQSEPIVSPPKKAKAAAANKPVAKKGTPQAAQPKKPQQPMKNSNKNQKKPFPKKR